MSKKPRIYGYCPAGCKWETVHKDDFMRSATFYEIGQNEVTAEAYRKYRIFADKNENTAKYKATIEFRSPDVHGDEFYTQATFTIDAGYRDYFDFEIMLARYVSTGADTAQLQLVYEVNCEQKFYTQQVQNLDLTKSVIKITGANQILLYNDTATILGKDGGYYTLNLTDNGDGTATMSFNASEEGMPTIDPVTFKITNGKDGKSAYEIYLDNGGTIGTEKAWVESLNGEDGESFYDMCVNNGFVGSETDLIIAMRGADGEDGGYYTQTFADNGDGTMTISFAASKEDMAAIDPIVVNLPTGTKGADGKSAYEIYLANGGTLSETEWLESLNGNDGEDGYTPVKGVDYYTDADKAELIAELSLPTPTIVSSVDEMTDTTKHYVNQSTGTIWAYQKHVKNVEASTKPNFTNVFNPDTAEIGYRWSGSSKAPQAQDKCTLSDFIACDLSSGEHTIRIKNAQLHGASTNAGIAYFSSNTADSQIEFVNNNNLTPTEEADGVLAYKLGEKNGSMLTNYAITRFIRCVYVKRINDAMQNATESIARNVIITIDEPITYTDIPASTEVYYEWTDTGISYAPTFKTDLIGVMGEGNIIYLSDNLPSGTYTLKYGDETYDTVGTITVE